MRLKKGFTLAEVLIVLMVIGAIATMSIPSLMKGVTEAQWKTAYKKAYNAVVNLCAMEKIAGQLPTDNTAVGVGRMFTALKNNLSVRDYSKAPSTAEIKNQGGILGPSAFYTNIEFSIKTETDSTSATTSVSGSGETLSAGTIGTVSPWISTEDNLAYAAFAGGSTTCKTKADINSAGIVADAVNASCVVVVVDVNGLANGPNVLEPQLGSDGSFDSSKVVDALTGDRYYIYIGLDGATAGSKKSTVTGRIVGDIK